MNSIAPEGKFHYNAGVNSIAPEGKFHYNTGVNSIAPEGKQYLLWAMFISTFVYGEWHTWDIIWNVPAFEKSSCSIVCYYYFMFFWWYIPYLYCDCNIPPVPSIFCRISVF